MELSIHKYIPISEVEGPGKRFVLWVQGCTIQCKNCFVPHTWNIEKGTKITVDELYEIILKYEDEIEGITIFGGEPFEQALALNTLLGRIKKTTSLSLMIFSGYVYEQLKRKQELYYKELLELCDIFVDGPYIEKLKNLTRPWSGSSNQRYFFFTDRYKNLQKEINHTNKVAITIKENGEVNINGLASKETINYLESIIIDDE